jgi:hypothetical protein
MAQSTGTVARTWEGYAIGGCGGCGEGIRLTLDDTAGRDVIDVECPSCALTVRLTKLVGTMSQDVCDSACMSAIRSECTCACGGPNHGQGWQTRVVHSFVPLPGQPIKVHRADASPDVRKRATARHARTGADRERRAAARVELAAQRERDAAARRDAMLTDVPQLGVLVSDRFDGSDSDFVIDMRRKVNAGEELSPRQLAACVNMVDATCARDAREVERDTADTAARAAGVRCPDGKHTFTGVIVSCKPHTDTQWSYHGRTTEKITVRTVDGWRVWGTVPASMQLGSYTIDTLEAWRKGLVGQTVTLTATVEASPQDQLFGFFKRARVATTDTPTKPASPRKSATDPAPVPTPASGWALL